MRGPPDAQTLESSPSPSDLFQVRPGTDGDPEPHRTPGPSKLCQILLALLAVGIVKPKVCETHPRNLYVWLVSRFSRWDSSLDVSRYSETPQPTFPPPAPASADDRLLSLPSPRSCLRPWAAIVIKDFLKLLCSASLFENGVKASRPWLLPLPLVST